MGVKAGDSGRPATLNREEIRKGHKVYRFFKRLQDIVLSLLALIVLSPFMLIVAIIIVIDDPSAGPVFAQNRIGRDGRELVGIQRSFLATESAISGFFYENARAL